MPQVKDLKIFEFAFMILERIISLKEYTSKEEILTVANNALDLIKDDETVSQELKEGYKNAIKRINIMTFEELKNIKNHI